MTLRTLALLTPISLLAAVAAPAQTTQPAAGTPQPIQITASQGIEWLQDQHEVIATGNAQAVRGNVTVDADQLIAHYRKKPASPGAPAPTPAAQTKPGTDPESALDGGDSEIYELDAIGHVHIFTPTDNAYGDHAVDYVPDSVLILTGAHLKLTTQHDTVTAKNAIEYYAQARMAVARGDAKAVSDDGRSIAADTLVAYFNPAPAAPPPPPGQTAAPPDMLDQAGKIQKIDAIGHVQVNTPTEEATGEKGVYLPDSGLARLGGDVQIINGPNHLSGSDAIVNTKTNVAQLLAGPGGQVAGTVVPNSGGTTQ
jgi:lipopolysaccharide export system protein LptA